MIVENDSLECNPAASGAGGKRVLGRDGFPKPRGILNLGAKTISHVDEADDSMPILNTGNARVPPVA